MDENFFKKPKKDGLNYLPRLVGHPTEVCCGEHPLLVEGNVREKFVKGKCAVCGKIHLLSRNDFTQGFQHFLKCHMCKEYMRTSISSLGRYGFICSNCNTAVLFVDILPHINDVDIKDKNLSNVINKVIKLQNMSQSVIAKARTNSEIKSLIKLNDATKKSHSKKDAISICINCSKFGKNTCPGPNIATGSYDRQSYYCSSFSRKHKQEDF